MEPLSILAAASAAVGTAKRLVEMGGDIENMIQQLGKWASYADQLRSWAGKVESKPPLFRALNFGNATQEALNAVMVKNKLAAQEKEIAELLQWHAPPGSYEAFIAERRRIRTEQNRMIYLQAQRRKAFLVNAGYLAALVVLLGALVWLGFIGYEMISEVKG
jgi:hypothetical protein